MEEKVYADEKRNSDKAIDSFKEKDTFREKGDEPGLKIKRGKKVKEKQTAETNDTVTHLHFEEDDLNDEKFGKAVKKADKAAGKADKVIDNLPKKKMVRFRSEPLSDAGEKLKFKETEEILPKPSTVKRAVKKAPGRVVAGTLHREAGKYEDDNVGVEAANEGVKFIENTEYVASDAAHFHKLHQYDKAEKLVEQSDKANVNAIYHKKRKDDPQQAGNPLSHWIQKRQIKREYAEIKRGENTAGSTVNTGRFTWSTAQSIISGAGNTVKEGSGIVEAAVNFISNNSSSIIALLAAGGLIMVIMGSFSSCSAFLPGSGGAVIATTYTAEDEDILGVEEDYCRMETELDDRINNIKDEYPDYDEYNFHLDEIGHDPFELASYLTVRFEDYKREEVQDEIRKLFDLQYKLDIEEKIETRSYTVSHTDTEADGSVSHWTETVYYDYYILNVTLRNNGLAYAISQMKFDEDEAERYDILMSTYGNKMYLFEDSIYAVTGEGEQYVIPGEALTDERFARMIREAEKYLGYPYVWGGSSPSTSFDCSGFVSWVINNCGNGWSVGRLTANGLMNVCGRVSSSDAKPGDLIFFEKTYNTSGASHVGIYVGDGMMIHCGNPIQYTSVRTSYWQSHFLCYGRLP